jgi:hypothetical protein
VVASLLVEDIDAAIEESQFGRLATGALGRLRPSIDSDEIYIGTKTDAKWSASEVPRGLSGGCQCGRLMVVFVLLVSPFLFVSFDPGQ